MTLRPKTRRPVIRQTDWFRPKRLPHFDVPILDRATAVRIACDATSVSRHPFLPLIAFSKRHRRFTSKGDGDAIGTTKKRPLAYCANRDAVIFSYYAYLLRAPYEALLPSFGIDDCVAGYRSGRSNIEIARDAFEEIASRGRCTTLALDISGFFDSVPHTVLKMAWMRVLGSPPHPLPADHYAVFRALTRYSKVDRDACLGRLGLLAISSLKDLPKPLCSIGDFRRIIRGDGTSMTSLVEVNRTGFGIPQGTPLSPVAANIAMLEFDIAVAAEVKRCGGSYRRYSDDILIICPSDKARRLEDFTSQALDVHATGLRLKAAKAQRVRFIPGRRAQPSLQYLGFTFDGMQILLRSATLARQWRRLAAAAHWAKRQHRKAVSGKIEGRATVHRKALLTRFSHLGAGNFHTGYAALSGKIMGTRAIRRQLRKHMRFIEKRLK